MIVFKWHRMSILTGITDVDEKEGLMDAMDEINERFGLGTLTVGSIKQGGDWQPLAASRSPAYISNWSALPIVEI